MDLGVSEQPSYSRKEKQEQELLLEHLKKVLEKKHREVVRDFRQKHQAFVSWVDTNKHSLFDVRKNLVQMVLAGSISLSAVAGVTLPGANQAQAPLQTDVAAATTNADPYQTVNDLLKQYKSWPSEQLENQVADTVTQMTKVPSKATLDGHKMNKLAGFFGQEQHLYRYPGDVLEDHGHTDEEKQKFLKYGIAPGLGAWGYFASSQTQFTKRDEMREKYYIAAQTFLFPGFYSDKSFKDWLKFKKVIVYNPQNGKAVVAVIGDSGPATWTGKSFGGSPELMSHLQMVDGKGKSEAVVLFVDDPQDIIPLGPVDMTPGGAL